MHEAVKQMLTKYQCTSQQDYTNALKEIFQEIALLGLWRAKFYEQAAFYGGSALRILYGLDRFSEDLDFTLLHQKNNFDLSPYNQAIADELNGFGFEAEVKTKNKNIDTSIKSDLIKAESKKQLIEIEAPSDIFEKIHHLHTIKIKMEVDTNPPGKFNTETKNILQPIPFFIKTLIPSDLFAGKVHAILCRPWQKRVKGRDWHDLIWYVGRDIPLNLTHLRERLIQSHAINRTENFNREELLKKLLEKIDSTDFNNGKQDIAPFINDQNAIDLWSKEFFIDIISKIKEIEKA